MCVLTQYSIIEFKTGLDRWRRWDRGLMSFMLPWFHEKNPEIPLDISAQEKPKAITLPYDLSHVLRLFSGAFLFLSADIAVFQIRQHLIQTRGKKGRGILSGLVIRAVFKGYVSCVLDPASVNDSLIIQSGMAPGGQTKPCAPLLSFRGSQGNL